MLIKNLNWCIVSTLKRQGSLFVSSRHLCAQKWHKIRQSHFPTAYALQHFDAFYPKVYDNKWLSMRIALHWPNKRVAVVNPFVQDPDEIAASFAIKGAANLSYFYNKYRKHYERRKLHRQLLEQKREAKRNLMAAERGVAVDEIQSDIEVSDISDSELGVVSAASDPENILEMFQTDIESLRDKDGFMENLSSNLDLNDFMPSTEMKYEEEVIDKDTYYRFYDSSCEVNVEIIEGSPLEIPDYPRMFSFPRESLESFDPPDTSSGSVDYLLIDAAAILPVLALEIQLGDRIADLCAAPGGKTLLMLSTLRPAFLFACDPDSSRFAALREKVADFLPKNTNLNCTYHLENCSAQDVDLESAFDKVIIDAPSTSDRLAVQDNHESYFEKNALKKRIELPNSQKSILVKGLKLLKPGGSLVYTTNTLSPIQNDGVVHMALFELSQTSNMVYNIVELKESLRPFRGLYRFHTFRYGTQVLPNIINNCGPVYMSKINRIK